MIFDEEILTFREACLAQALMASLMILECPRNDVAVIATPAGDHEQQTNL
jgi:hypothetical protein